MKIEVYISELLYRYQCVTVPGFGAFLTEIQSARYDNEMHTFYPPQKQLSFNSYIKNNDGLLATHVAAREKISYDEAVKALAYQANLWSSALKNGETLVLPNIGTFAVTSELNWVFSPTEIVNYLPEAFGLSTVPAYEVKRVIDFVAEQPTEVTETTETTIATEPEVITLEQPSKRYAFLRYAAAFFIIAGVGTGAYKLQLEQEAQQAHLLAEQKVQQKVLNTIEQATFVIENPLPAVSIAMPQETVAAVKPYHLVAGSFRNEANAQRIFEELQALGFEPVRLPANAHGLHPVLYGSYSSYSEAQEKLHEIHKNHNKEAWLLIKEL